MSAKERQEVRKSIKEGGENEFPRVKVPYRDYGTNKPSRQKVS